MTYFNLPNVERITAKNKDYYYLRKTRTSRRFRLPDPKTNTRKVCELAYMEANKQAVEAGDNGQIGYHARGVKPSMERFLDMKRPGISDRTFDLYSKYNQPLFEMFGSMYIHQLTADHFIDLRDSFDSASTANTCLWFYRSAWNWFVKNRFLAENPVLKVHNRDHLYKGIPRWTEQEIKQFEDFWPLGSWPRLAFDIHLKIGCRVSDALKLNKSNLHWFGYDGWKYVNGEVRYSSAKTRMPTFIRIDDELLGQLDHVIQGNKHFICHPRTKKPLRDYDQFYKLFRRACLKAGVNKSVHGLRKAFAIRHALNGASSAELKALGGWQSLAAVEIYIKEAEREKLSLQASSRPLELTS